MPTIDISLLDEQISTLEAHLAKCQENIDVYQGMVSEERGAAEHLAIRINALMEFRKLAANSDPKCPQRRRSGTPKTKKLKASAAIRELLSRHPDGLTRGQIIDAVTPMVNSSAKNPRHNVRTTIFNMKRSERLEYDKKAEVYRIPKKK